MKEEVKRKRSEEKNKQTNNPNKKKITLWAPERRHEGDIWATSGRHLGNKWASLGYDFWAIFGRPMVNRKSPEGHPSVIKVFPDGTV